MAFFNLFPLILQYYQFVAMCPISLPREKSQVNMNNWFLIIWSIINVIFLCFLTVLFLIYSDIIYDENNDIGRFQDIVKFGTILLTHFFILVETLYTRRHQFEFWQLRNQVDACLEEMDIEPTIYRRKFETDYTKKFISYQVVTWIVEIYIISTVQDDIQWLEFWFATIYSLMMTRSRHFQHSMYIDLITARFKAIKHELNTMVQLSKKGSIDETHNKRMLQKLKLMRSAYNTLYEMNGHLNKSIGLSQLFNFMQNFIQLTSDLYWIYSVLYKNTFEHLFQISLNLIPTFWSVIAVLYSSEKCLKNANFIGFLLHNIEKGNDNRQLDLLVSFITFILTKDVDSI